MMQWFLGCQQRQVNANLKIVRHFILHRCVSMAAFTVLIQFCSDVLAWQHANMEEMPVYIINTTGQIWLNMLLRKKGKKKGFAYLPICKQLPLLTAMHLIFTPPWGSQCTNGHFCSMQWWLPQSTMDKWQTTHTRQHDFAMTFPSIYHCVTGAI